MRDKNREAGGFKRGRAKAAPERGDWIYGRRPVSEVLKAGGRHVYEAVLPPEGDDAPGISAIRAAVIARNIPFKHLEREEMDLICDGGNHQGVALRTGSFPYISFEQIIHDVKENPDALVIILDHIEDPQNTGSILRTANAVGATGVILPEDRAAGVTPAAVRASAGASEHMRVAKVVNLTRAIKSLQDAGAWVTALDIVESSRSYTAVDFKGRVVLVVGNEGKGVSRLVRESSDFVAALPMAGKIESLNAGVAAAIVMFEVVRQRALKE